MRYLSIAIIAVITSCSNHTQLSPLSENGVILTFGDSLTSGTGVTKELSYPSVLQKLSNKVVLNYGSPGEITANGVQRFNNIIEELPNVELLLLLEGGNDFLRSINHQITKNNLANIIKSAQKYNIQVVLISVPHRSLFLKDAKIYQELAEKFDILLIDEVLTDLLSQPKYKSDMIHLNQQGYEILATKIYQQLKQAGALE